jgi:Flp pilus assembly protein TadD
MLRPVPSFQTVLSLALLALLASPGIADAQMSARVRGTVLDLDGRPVDGATVVFDYQGGLSRQLEATTNDEGEYLQMGLQRGPYTVKAIKDGVGERAEEITLRVGQQIELDFTLVPVGMRTMGDLSEAERAEYERETSLRASMDAAVAASVAGDYDDAIAKFEEVLAEVPDCHECQNGIGMIHAQREEYDDAETAFQRAIEIDPDYGPAYEGLAGIYNAQRRFDEAVAASERAAELSGGGGAAGGAADPDTVFNQGLINWNAGNVEEAKAQFVQTLELDPDHGEAHYWMGMANLNEGNLSEAAALFERYVELEPDGRFAEQAQGMLTQLPR